MDEEGIIKVYKLFRCRRGKLHPMFVECRRIIPMHQWVMAGIGKLVDENHVSSRMGHITLRPGFHVTLVPFMDWTGKRMPDGSQVQFKDSVWCECKIRGREMIVSNPNGIKDLPDDYYYYKTRKCAAFPWIISRWIYVEKMLSHDEVEALCMEHGIHAQPMEE
jgi:hypothetical protein